MGCVLVFPLYNVYLNEADEWSRRLVTEVAEWSMEASSASQRLRDRAGPFVGRQLGDRRLPGTV